MMERRITTRRHSVADDEDALYVLEAFEIAHQLNLSINSCCVSQLSYWQNENTTYSHTPSA